MEVSEAGTGTGIGTSSLAFERERKANREQLLLLPIRPSESPRPSPDNEASDFCLIIFARCNRKTIIKRTSSAAPRATNPPVNLAESPLAAVWIELSCVLEGAGDDGSVGCAWVTKAAAGDELVRLQYSF